MEALKHKKTFFISIFISILTVSIIKGFYDNQKKGSKVAEDILTVLNENCDCKEVTQSLYSLGLQYSWNDGFSTEKAEYQLTDCTYLDFNNEVKRIDKLLQSKVKGIKDFNLITLDFIDKGQRKSVSINNTNNSKNEN
ncbi:hypothetical protein [Olleya sp. YS]|uniref:hypothetical protein n=1 Tax=Olleya sp. YS TaxID=3028318 RepID=UPI0024343FF0|nr:hypothetical protein [Olleya sp. YS]WGD35681.1 hypothetical protein Ollyesu_04545 [Olleya sp. YS]